ncbi:MAG: ATP-binding protein, partial [Aestuariivirgaceae bacterium]
GRLLVELMDAESRKTVRDYLAALGEGGIASIFNDGREVSAIAAQGGKIPVFLTIGRMGTNGEARLRPGSAPAFCAVMRDITQWKKTEAELRRAKDEAEKASAQKSDFLARISHELRTPLNAILGFSEVMRSERFGEMRNTKYLAYANDIHTSGEHLLSLINDLLDLSKVEAGKLELNFTSVNLAELAEHCLKLMEEEARGRRVILRRNFAAGLPNVVADLRSMKQILLNLISNAIKFTAAGGQVIVSGQTRPSGEFVLRVKDTGVGIAPEALAIALTPFGRAHDDEHPEIGGTGLGLPLTKALAEANRARFEITSKPEKGTSVEIVFPVNRVLAG